MSKIVRVEYLLEKYKKEICESLYFLIFFIFVSIESLNTTMLRIRLSEAGYFYITVLAIMIVIGKTAADSSWRMKEIILASVACIGLLASGYRWGYTGLIRFAILIVGAKNISSRKILKVYFALSTFILLLAMAFALTGRIPNLIYYQAAHGNKARIAFGSVYPTDFSAHIFFLSCIYAWLRGKNIKKVELVIIAGLGVFVYAFCNARMNTMALLGLAVFLGYVNVRRGYALKSGKAYTMSKVLRGICCISAPIFAGLSIVLSYFYSPNNLILEKINAVLNNRLRFARTAFDIYNVPLVGQYVEMRGAGGTTSKIEEYFFLDSSYINILFRMGIVTLIGIMIIFLVIQYRENKMHSWEHMGILALICAQCFVEHHMLEIAYNPFLLLLFAAPVAYTVSGKVEKNTK